MEVKKIALWILTVLVGLMFIWSGIMKVTDLGGVSSAGFEMAGLPLWFMYLIGALEIIGGAALFFSMTAFWGAIGLIIIMVGAVVVTAMNNPLYMAVMPLVFAIVLGIIIWLRRSR